jgi:hypothetical protein
VGAVATPPARQDLARFLVDPALRQISFSDLKNSNIDTAAKMLFGALMTLAESWESAALVAEALDRANQYFLDHVLMFGGETAGDAASIYARALRATVSRYIFDEGGT